MNNRLFILAIFIATVGCTGNSVGGGGCTYEKFEVKAEIAKLIIENDTINEVEFKLDDRGFVTLNQWDFKGRVEFDFEQELLKEEVKGYIVSGDRIKNGTCAPYRVEKLNLKKMVTTTGDTPYPH